MSQQTGTQVSSQFLNKMLKGASKAIPYLGQADLGKQILGKISKEIIGYDFFGLLTKILFFYVFAFIIDQYFKAVVFGSGVIQTAASIFQIKLPAALPEKLKNFILNGTSIKIGSPDPGIGLGEVRIRIQLWDFINILAFFLLLGEAITYFQNNKRAGGKYSWFTVGTFGILTAGVGFIAFSKMFGLYQTAQKIISLENLALQQKNSGDTSKALASLQAASALVAANINDIDQLPLQQNPVTQ